MLMNNVSHNHTHTVSDVREKVDITASGMRVEGNPIWSLERRDEVYSRIIGMSVLEVIS